MWTKFFTMEGSFLDFGDLQGIRFIFGNIRCITENLFRTPGINLCTSESMCCVTGFRFARKPISRESYCAVRTVESITETLAKRFQRNLRLDAHSKSEIEGK